MQTQNNNYHLRLGHNKITSESATLLFNTLRYLNSSINTIGLWNNLIDDKCIEALGEFLENNQYLKQMDLMYNKITDTGICLLSKYLNKNTVLEAIKLEGNQGITDASIECFNNIVKNSKVTRISLFGTSVSANMQAALYHLCKEAIHKQRLLEEQNHAILRLKDIIKQGARSLEICHV